MPVDNQLDAETKFEALSYIRGFVRELYLLTAITLVMLKVVSQIF